MVIIPKASTDTWGIDLLETLWKAAEVIIDTRIPVSIHFHDVTRRFWYVRGTETAIMELKIAQELTRMDHKILFLIFLELSKAYNNVDRGRLIWTLEGYCVGPCLCELLATFWVHQKVVPRQNGYHVLAFLDK